MNTSSSVFRLVMAAALCALYACKTGGPERSLMVTATAYNSVKAQTDDNPTEAAWGDELKPGMKVVAVSRDLLALGLTRGKVLRIDGLWGEYVVLDRTARRLRRRVDVYMGVDVERAKAFGKKKVRIYWRE